MRDSEDGREPIYREGLATANNYFCFKAPEVETLVSELPAITAGKVTFGCFNNLMKINEAVIETWSSLLRAIPDAELFLKTKVLVAQEEKEKIRELF